MSEPFLVAATVVELTSTQTHPLRLAVLRQNVPTKEVVFAEDDMPGAVHLGVTIDGELIAVSSWIPRPHGDVPAVQLRGMATAHHCQGTGMGGLLLAAGCARAASVGHRVVWARARDAALSFYERHGFIVDGDGFIDGATQLPHHVVVRHIA
jgi:predicted GNAT family N-acyltransferase